MPGQESNRQELMNAGPHHAKLRVTAHVTAPIHVAGSDVTGKIDVECRAEKGLGLGTIMVELMAIQELNSRDHAATSTFIHTRRIFQGPGLPPSNAVIAEDESGAFPPHHYPARRGITTFFFRFPLPLTSPASIEFGSGLARIRYEVRASASVAWKGERRLVTDRQATQVVESAMQEVESAGTVVGESGKIWMQAKVLGGAVIAGQTCCIELHVKNHSSRKTTGVNVSLRRVLHLDNPPPEHANIIVSDTLVTAPFNSSEYCCPPGVEGVAKLVINVPRTARTVKGGSRESGEAGSDKAIPALFDVRGSITVRLSMGAGAKDLSLDLPVVISHPAAIPPEPPFLGPPIQSALTGRSTSPFPPYEPPRSPFPPPHSPVHLHQPGYAPHPPSSPVPYTQVYFPPMSPQPPNILNYFPAPPMSPTLPMSPGPLMAPGPPMSPALPFSPAPPFTPIIPPAPMYYNTDHPHLPHSPGPPVSPVLPQTLNIPQFAHAQSMPQLGHPQSPQRHDGLSSRGPLPPLPPRPTSAEPHVHQVGVDLPATAGPSSPAAARIFPPLEGKAEGADGVEGKGARASRISEHLRMSSRTRSVSPTGRRFAGARPRPPPQSPISTVDAGVKQSSPHSTVLPLPGGARPSRNKSQNPNHSRSQSPPKGAQDGTGQPAIETPSVKTPRAIAVQPVAPRSTPQPPDTDKEEVLEKELPPPPPPLIHDGSATTSPKVLPPANELQSDNVQVSSSTPIHSVSRIVPELDTNLEPLRPVPTGLTALERRLTARIDIPASSRPVRKPAPKPQLPSPSAQPEPGTTIDWGEIARIGKLKSFALERKKPAVTSFLPPTLPSDIFDKPKPKVVPVPRKLVPSLDSEQAAVRHELPPTTCPPSPPRINQVPMPANDPIPAPETKHLVRYQLSDPPMSKVPSNQSLTNQPRTSATQASQAKVHPRTNPPNALAVVPPIIPSQPFISSKPSSTSDQPISPCPPSAPQLSSPIQPSAATPVSRSQRPDSVHLPLLEQPIRHSSINQSKATPTILKSNTSSTVSVAPTVLKAPQHAIRYQLSDPPVSKSQPTQKPTLVNQGAPLNSIPNYRAVLKPASAPKPVSPTKSTPTPVEQNRINIQTFNSPPVPNNPLTRTNTPRVPSFPLPELEPRGSQQGDVRVASQPPLPLPRRSPSPQRPRPQPAIQSQPIAVAENRPVAQNRAQPSEPRRVSAESQAAQKARYFESLATGGPSSLTKPKPVRHILRPQEANAPPDRLEPLRAVQSQPPAEARPTPRSSPFPAVNTNPTVQKDDTGPKFTAMPVPPTAPTARSLIPVTSSGFEVPAILPGNDARERADAALREAELFRLKREAISRVPLWLDSDVVSQAPPPTRATRPAGHGLPAYSNRDLRHGEDEPTMAELLAGMDKPATRAVYDPQLKHPQPRPIVSKSAAALMPNDAELLAKYDIRSARGGKGGQVTAIASIWQNAAPGSPANQPVPSVATRVSSQPNRAIPASPLLNGSQGTIKSTSVPTMMYPATAVPVLSSTASLARPIGGPGPRVRQTTFPASIPESQSDDILVRRTSQPTPGTAVGQARLKELIGKYQS